MECAMEMGDIQNIAMLALMYIVFGVPVLALAARIAIRPVLEAIITLREGGTAAATPDPRLAALEAEVARLATEVGRLSEAEAFHRQLQAPTTEASATT